MPCYHPLNGFRARHVNPETGKRSVVFDPQAGYVDLPVVVVCGRCIGCRLERSRQWAMRCVHEAQLHEDNAFITLTYDDQHLPVGGTLVKKHFQDFMKRLRRRFAGVKLLYYHCGEYGERTKRPHYHALLFGVDFRDREIYRERDSVRLFTSVTLSKLWGMGFCTVGAVTFESAAYTARYILKKITGADAGRHYDVVVPDTGEIVRRLPEYTTMSNGGGRGKNCQRRAIGQGWFERYHGDVYPDDFVVLRGQRMKPPKYYDRRFELGDPAMFVAVKERRVGYAAGRKGDNTPERLAVRKKCKEAQISQLKRELE